MNEAFITYILPKGFLMDFSYYMFNLILQSTININTKTTQFSLQKFLLSKEAFYYYLSLSKKPNNYKVPPFIYHVG